MPQTRDPWDRRAVFIVSTGRTGTQFLADALPAMVEDCAGFHEPDTLWLDRSWEYVSSHLWRQIRRHGLYQMTLGQLHRTVVHLSTARHAGRIDDEAARRWLRSLRERFLAEVPQSIYLESNGLLYGVVDLLLEQMPRSKFVVVVREPRAWVRSALLASHFRAYKPPDFDFLRFSIRPYYLDDADYSKAEWTRLPLAHKYVWLWGIVNRTLLRHLEDGPRAAIFRYEDLFEHPQRTAHFEALLRFVSRWDDGFERRAVLDPALVDRPVDSTRDGRGGPDLDLPDELIERHCGDLMRRLGYPTP